MLAGSEFKIVGTAVTGTKALEKCEELNPDIVLLDIVLPDRSGSEIITNIREINPKTSIIMVSSLGTQGKVVECLRKGAVHFITKPFDRAILLETLRDFKHGGRGSVVQTTVDLSLAGVSLGMKFFEIHVGMKFFGQYLMEKGLIDKEQLLKGIKYQKSINLSLEDICLKKDMLTKGQVEKIHEIQKADLDKDFGEIVLVNGFLTKENLDKVVEEQRNNWVFIGESLVKIKALGYNQLAEALKDYKEEQEKDEWEIGTRLGAVRNNLIVKTFVNFTMKIFYKIIKEPVKLKECSDSVEGFELRDYTIQQRIRGDMSLFFIVNISEDVCFKIASALFDREVKEIKNIEQDALKEFLNVISGNCCAKLSNIGINLETRVPEFYENKTQEKYSLPQRMQNAFALVISGIGDFDLVILRDK